MRFIHALLIVIALWAALFIPGLGDTELKGEEGRRILPAREMLRRDNFVLPYSEGRPYHRKPPGINWAIAAAFKVTGVQNEWTARLPSVLALLALALAGLWAGKQVGGQSIGLALAIALLINGGMLEKARLAEIESLYVSLAGIGMLLWAANWASLKSPWVLWLSTVIPFMLANLVKGPVYLLFFYPIVFFALKRTNRLKDIFSPAHFVSLALALAPMVIWGFLVKQQIADLPTVPAIIDDDGNEIVARTPGEVWWQQISGRLAFDRIDAAEWAELPFRVLLILAPWPILGWISNRINRRSDKPLDRLGILRKALGWGSFLSILAFCLLPATRARYLMPALAPVCFWAVLSIMPALERSHPLQHNWKRLMVGFMFVAGAIALILPFCLQFDSKAIAFSCNLVGVILLSLLLVRILKMEPDLKFFLLMVPPFATLSLVLATTVLPTAKLHENVRPTAEAINAAAPNPGSIAAMSPGPQPFLFYLGTRCAEVTRITEFPPDTAYVLIDPDYWKRPEVRDRFEYQGLNDVRIQVKDQRFDNGREYLLIGREPGFVRKRGGE